MANHGAKERTRARQLARLGALFAGFAHEIRNPLSTIGLNLQLVREDFGEAVEPRERRMVKRLDVVEGEVKRLQSILDEFLGFVRIPDLDLQPIDLNGMLAEIVDFVRPELERESIGLQFYPGQDVRSVMLDEGRFRAVIVNLLRNALDACESGDQVLVASRLRGPQAEITVTDTGRGMSAETIEHAFQPYFSTKKHGTGLGLPTARMLVEQHGGTLEVSSDEGQGTRFVATIPAILELPERPVEARMIDSEPLAADEAAADDRADAADNEDRET